ncbi:MAG: RrF2 family transcriptional regulator [Desulfosoma sp.]|uniref:RrF2 family transcriptional regulator n=1 Tax=Desulfosoma sp. TaxID=2603217 RepID=UPI00404A44E9
MKLSTRSRYGTRMMLYLARNGEQSPVQLHEIASHESISVKYLEQLIIPLKKANLVTSVRGAKGGHRLARSPDKITIGDVVRAVERQTELVECLSHPQMCERAETCPARPVWNMPTRAMYQVLDSLSLSDVVQTEQALMKGQSKGEWPCIRKK